MHERDRSGYPTLTVFKRIGEINRCGYTDLEVIVNLRSVLSDIGIRQVLARLGPRIDIKEIEIISEDNEAVSLRWGSEPGQAMTIEICGPEMRIPYRVGRDVIGESQSDTAYLTRRVASFLAEPLALIPDLVYALRSYFPDTSHRTVSQYSSAA